uniref:arginine--tRNA ligase n=1 Tax=Toxoplasma gondii (strain ATCC 50861 / VEG) TaxID=432359 RepID=A0A0F7V2M2_TOXGV|nr:TPA: arginyl-tRNA synthetase, putative [Toxoplasma gondii VEG]
MVSLPAGPTCGRALQLRHTPARRTFLPRFLIAVSFCMLVTFPVTSRSLSLSLRPRTLSPTARVTEGFNRYLSPFNRYRFPSLRFRSLRRYEHLNEVQPRRICRLAGHCQCAPRSHAAALTTLSVPFKVGRIPSPSTPVFAAAFPLLPGSACDADGVLALTPTQAVQTQWKPGAFLSPPSLTVKTFLPNRGCRACDFPLFQSGSLRSSRTFVAETVRPFESRCSFFNVRHPAFLTPPALPLLVVSRTRWSRSKHLSSVLRRVLSTPSKQGSGWCLGQDENRLKLLACHQGRVEHSPLWAFRASSFSENSRPSAGKRSSCREREHREPEIEARPLPSVLELRHWLEDRLRNAISIAMGGEDLRDDIPVIVTEAIAPARSLFDFQSSIAISLSGRGGGAQSAEAIAEGLLNNLENERQLLERVVSLTGVSGRGFINFRLSSNYLASRLVDMLLNTESGSCLGFQKVETPERIVVDYASPNICKDLHVGHLRSAVVGDTLANLLEFAGHRVFRHNHLGDFGWPVALVLGALADAELRERPDVQALNEVLEQRIRDELEHKEGERAREESEDEGSKQNEQERKGAAREGSKDGASGKGGNRKEAEANPGVDEELHVDWRGIYQAAKAKAQKDDVFKRACGTLLLRLQTEKNSALSRTWEALRRLSLENFESVYRLLGLHRQDVLGESFYAPLISRVLHFLETRGLLLSLPSGALCGALTAREAAAETTAGAQTKERENNGSRLEHDRQNQRPEEGQHALNDDRENREPRKESDFRNFVEGREGEQEGYKEVHAKETESSKTEGECPGSNEEIGFSGDIVVLKKPGNAVTYAATDLAAILYRSASLQADRVLYVVDSAQDSHFKRVFSLARAAGIASAIGDDLREMGGKNGQATTKTAPQPRGPPDGVKAEEGDDERSAWGARRGDEKAGDGGMGVSISVSRSSERDVERKDALEPREQPTVAGREHRRHGGACKNQCLHRDSPGTQLEHVIVGLVKNTEGTKMKSREGQAPHLAGLLQDAIRHAEGNLGRRTDDGPLSVAPDAGRPEDRHTKARILGIAAVKYAELSTRRDVDYVFSPEKVLSPKGNTAPYILYSLVRVKGILRRAGWAAGIPSELRGKPNLLSDMVYHLHRNDLDRQLGVRLLGFAIAIEDAIQTLMPSKLTAYLYSVCLLFNAFYEECEVTKATDEGLRLTRLLLVHGVRQVLEKCLDLLGIQAVETL